MTKNRNTKNEIENIKLQFNMQVQTRIKRFTKYFNCPSPQRKTSFIKTYYYLYSNRLLK